MTNNFENFGVKYQISEIYSCLHIFIKKQSVCGMFCIFLLSKDFKDIARTRVIYYYVTANKGCLEVP